MCCCNYVVLLSLTLGVRAVFLPFVCYRWEEHNIYSLEFYSYHAYGVFLLF